ncbi:MAG: hypothetical protein JWO67_4764 [Streptosporangiaceae bacterium]|nr:hypothetical protein [Streptosporangiaceae bacterium]
MATGSVKSAPAGRQRPARRSNDAAAARASSVATKLTAAVTKVVWTATFMPSWARTMSSAAMVMNKAADVMAATAKALDTAAATMGRARSAAPPEETPAAQPVRSVSPRRGTVPPDAQQTAPAAAKPPVTAKKSAVMRPKAEGKPVPRGPVKARTAKPKPTEPVALEPLPGLGEPTPAVTSAGAPLLPPAVLDGEPLSDLVDPKAPGRHPGHGDQRPGHG